MSGNHRAFPRNGNTSAMEFGKIFFYFITVNVHRSLGVSDASLGLDVVFAGSGFNSLGVTLEVHPQSVGHSTVEGGRLGPDEKRV